MLKDFNPNVKLQQMFVPKENDLPKVLPISQKESLKSELTFQSKNNKTPLKEKQK